MDALITPGRSAAGNSDVILSSPTSLERFTPSISLASIQHDYASDGDYSDGNEEQRPYASLSSLAELYGDYLYDYQFSTEDHYAFLTSAPLGVNVFIGKYAAERASLDYSYHKYYTQDRQLLHDSIIDQFVSTIAVEDVSSVVNTEVHWMVFTAGAMGVGKGYVMRWLHENQLFPLSAFVVADCDAIREMLPEIKQYYQENPINAGELTQKEAGYISEVIILHCLRTRKNLLVDGSLRDAKWYTSYINNIKTGYPQLHLAIIHVHARDHQTILQRANTRAEASGRIVPEHIIMESIVRTSDSVRALAPLVDFVVHFINENSGCEPTLLYSMEDDDESKESFEIQKNEAIVTADDWKTKFTALWKMSRPPVFGRMRHNTSGLLSLYRIALLKVRFYRFWLRVLGKIRMRKARAERPRAVSMAIKTSHSSQYSIRQAKAKSLSLALKRSATI